MGDGWGASVSLQSYMMCLLRVPVSIEQGRAVRVSLHITLPSTPALLLMPRTERAADAPVIRQLFSSSPKDPRYHMLSYISHKFSQEIKPQPHEPRAALFLNRFTRTLTIVYATNGLANVLGISADELRGKSFYYCIQENCLNDAVKCLESAKANDSIAYLRFWFRDPRQEDQIQDEHMDGNSSGEDEDGGVHLDDRMDEAVSEHAVASDSSASQAESSVGQNSTERSSVDQDSHHLLPQNQMLDPTSRTSSDNSTDIHSGANEAIFDQPATRQSSYSSFDFSASDERQQSPTRPRSPGPLQIELEAVVSCTSDGLVVVLRRARALVPQVAQPTTAPIRRSYENGFFASPWATDPVLPNIDQRRHDPADHHHPGLAPIRPTVAQADTAAMKGPDQEDFMNSIREVAVFAWSLTGINGSLARYGRGKPTGESMPPDGLPIWQPDRHYTAEQERHPYHGNNPQESRQHGLPREHGGTPNKGFNNEMQNENTNGYRSLTYDQPGSNYGNGHSSASSNERDYGYSTEFRHEPYRSSSNGPHNFSYNSCTNGHPDVSHRAPDDGSGGDFQDGQTIHGENGLWVGDHPGYSSAKHDRPRYDLGHAMDNRDTNAYFNGNSNDHGHAMDTRDTNAYFNGNSNDHGSYGSNGATRGDEAPWLSQSHQSQHWDGLMPGPTSSHGHVHYESLGGFQR